MLRSLPLLVLLVAFGDVVSAQLSRESVRWHELKYEASKFGFSSSTTVRLETLDSAVAEDELLDVAGRTTRMPAGETFVKLILDAELPFGKSQTTIWL